jgi:hypothetical protein
MHASHKIMGFILNRLLILNKGLKYFQGALKSPNLLVLSDSTKFTNYTDLYLLKKANLLRVSASEVTSMFNFCNRYVTHIEGIEKNITTPKKGGEKYSIHDLESVNCVNDIFKRGANEQNT